MQGTGRIRKCRWAGGIKQPPAKDGWVRELATESRDIGKIALFSYLFTFIL